MMNLTKLNKSQQELLEIIEFHLCFIYFDKSYIIVHPYLHMFYTNKVLSCLIPYQNYFRDDLVTILTLLQGRKIRLRNQIVLQSDSNFY